MKKTPLFIASAIGLTLAFYLAAYYLLPGPPPSGAMVALFAAVALAIVWVVGTVWSRRHAGDKKAPPPAAHSLLLWIALGAVASMLGCNAAAPPRSSPPPSAGTSNRSPAIDTATLDRVTGTAVLLSREKEPAGYGLYSYALLFHPPAAAEVPRYTAFLKALVDLPTAEGLAQYVPKDRINITAIPLTAADPAWGHEDADTKVAYILKHYDYDRSAAIRAALATRVGSGPILLSVLHPIDLAAHPRPVLVQDMSLAQTSLMTAYVQAFVSQAAQDRFWQTSTLQEFALSLRNTLETAATGLSLSQTAVDGWVKFFK